LQGGVDVDGQTAGHPTSLGDHEHRFRQPAGITVLQGLELFQAHVETLGQFGDRQPLPLTAMAQRGAQGLEGSDGLVAWGV
jgi:hypothetical protein